MKGFGGDFNNKEQKTKDFNLLREQTIKKPNTTL